MERQNFISTDRKTVKNSFGNYFTVGDIVTHQDTSLGSAKIIAFEPDVQKNEIKVFTDKGYAYIDFIVDI